MCVSAKFYKTCGAKRLQNHPKYTFHHRRRPEEQHASKITQNTHFATGTDLRSEMPPKSPIIHISPQTWTCGAKRLQNHPKHTFQKRRGPEERNASKITQNAHNATGAHLRSETPLKSPKIHISPQAWT